MPFLWNTAEELQIINFVNRSIKIEGAVDAETTANITVDTAMIYENEAVEEVKTILSIGFEGLNELTADTVPHYLKFASGMIASVSMYLMVTPGTLGDIGWWSIVTQRQIYATLTRMVLGRETIQIEGLTPKTQIADIDIEFLLNDRDIEARITNAAVIAS